MHILIGKLGRIDTHTHTQSLNEQAREDVHKQSLNEQARETNRCTVIE